MYKLRQNIGIAHKVYQSQIRKLEKSPKDMTQVFESEKKIHDIGFVEFVDNLDREDRNMIQNSEIKYFIPWRAVWTENSLSTPCRLVFDASQTTNNGCSLNDLLAKGTNNMNKLVEILIRWSMRANAFQKKCDVTTTYLIFRLSRRITSLNVWM